MGESLNRCSTDSASSSPAQSSTPPQRDEPAPFCSPMNGAESLRKSSSDDAAKALVEAWQDAAHYPAAAHSQDGGAGHGGDDAAFSNGMAPEMPTAAEMELRAQLEMATARCAALEEQNSALWEGSPPDSARFSGATSPTADGGPRMPVPQGEDVAAVLALAPPELRACEPVVALERLIADRDEELAFLRERCVQFEVEVEAEFEDLSAQLFEAQQKVHELQQSLTESDAKRKHMEGAKQMLEGKLQDAGVQLMECERQLAEAVGGGGSAGRSPKAGNGRVGHRDSAAQAGGSLANSPGTPPTSDPRNGHPFFNNILEDEARARSAAASAARDASAALVEKLKDENHSLMEELVAKKMALAELSENHARLKRDLHRRAERDKAVTTKMSRIHAIMNGTAPLNSLQIHEKGHLLANSPSAASLSRRLSQGGTPLSSGDGSLQRIPSGRPSSSGTSGGTATPYKARWEPDRDFVRPWR